jgi:hypothetical protein
VFHGATVARAELSEVLARLIQTQVGVRAATDFPGVVVVLTVILPKANRANPVASPFRQRPAPAARAAIQAPIFGSRLRDVGEGHGAWSGLTAPLGRRAERRRLQRRVIQPSLSRSSRLRPLPCVSVLLKADDSALAQLPHVRELRVNRLARGLHLPPVSSFHDDDVAAFHEVLREDGEVLHVGHDALKYTSGHGLWADVWIAIGIDEVLGLSPLDLGVEAAQYCRYVSLAERVVDGLHNFTVLAQVCLLFQSV